jgi:hypothetical protein
MARILFFLTVLFLLSPAVEGAIIFQDDMESGATGWSSTGLWHLAGMEDPCQNAFTGSHSWYYGTGACNYDTGSTNSGSLTSPPITIPSGLYSATLHFNYWYETETYGIMRDKRLIQVSVDGGPFQTIAQLYNDSMRTWLSSEIDLSAYIGHTIKIRFYFDTVDDFLNNFRGWYIDDVIVSGIYPYDMNPNAPFNWIDISNTGTNTGIHCDDCGVWIPIGFSFPFFGQYYDYVGISSNGYLTFGPDLAIFNNVSIPNPGAPNNLIAVFWDDLYLSSDSNIYYQVIGSAPDRKLVIQYNRVDFYGGEGNLYFQVILSEDGSIVFQYKDMLSVNPSRGSGSSATIGIENGGGSWGIQYSYNTSGAITDNKAILFKPKDTDNDGLPDYWESLYGTDPNNPNDPQISEDRDGDGLNWHEEYLYGTNPFKDDTDGDTVKDGEEVQNGTNPWAREPWVVISFAGPAENYGIAYFSFNVISPIDGAQGFRVYYGPKHGVTIDDYPAYYDINNLTTRSGYIDQKWGMQGVPMVYIRVAPIMKIGDRTYIGPLSNEVSTYFGGYKSPQGNDQTDVKTDTGGGTRCFIATAAFGSPYEAPVRWLRLFRDRYLLTNAPGRAFVSLYYKISPPVADFIKDKEALKLLVRILLIPFVVLSYVLVEGSSIVKFAFVAILCLSLISLLVVRKKNI